MANPTVISLQLVAGVSNGIAQSQAATAATPLTLNGSLVSGGVATMDVARRVIIASNADDHTVVFTLSGTDVSGNKISETITGVTSTNTVQSRLNYLTITGIVPSATTVGNITVGTNSVGSSPWYTMDWLRRHGDFGVGGGITGPSGTTYTLEHCYSDPNSIVGQGIVGAEQWSMDPLGLIPPHVYTYASINGASGDNQFTYSNPVFAIRLTVNSGTGLVTLEMIQAGV
jgi:hypothetical protein